MEKSKNINLNKARKIKNDEFYTRIEDIQKELYHYAHYFKNKVVFLNCDDPEKSQFFWYFKMKFRTWGIKKLIATHYQLSPLFGNKPGNNAPAYKIEVTKVNQQGEIKEKTVTALQGDGDFRSKECIELLQSADIVCTNPPFSLFGEYINVLMKHQKQFLIIGNKNALVYKNIFPYVISNKIWTGHNLVNHFLNEKNEQVGSPAIWFTNLEHDKRNQKQLLFRKYDPQLYPKYDYVEAINVDKTRDIPVDYQGLMGVPVSFLLSYNPQQFKIIDAINRRSVLGKVQINGPSNLSNLVNGKCKFIRMIIKRKDL